MKHQNFWKPDRFWTKTATNRLGILERPSERALFERFSCLCSYLRRFGSYDIKCFFLHFRFGKRSRPVVKSLRTRPWTSVNTTEVIRRFVKTARDIRRSVKTMNEFVNTAGNGQKFDMKKMSPKIQLMWNWFSVNSEWSTNALSYSKKISTIVNQNTNFLYDFNCEGITIRDECKHKCNQEVLLDS